MTAQSSKIHQATCVAIGGRSVLIEGPPGSGKSSLALTLIDRGGRLVGDDGVTLAVNGGRLFASPAKHTAGLIEVRNIGLISLSAVVDVPVALVLMLDDTAPRFVETAEQIELLNVALPLIRLWPHSAVLALRAEAALAKYGIG